MKHLLLIFTFLSFAFATNAQNNEVIKLKADKKAKEYSEYLSKHMSLNRSEKAFIEKTFYTRSLYIFTYAKGEDVTKDYRKALMKKSNQWLEDELNKKFSVEDTKEILALIKEKRKKEKKSK